MKYSHVSMDYQMKHESVHNYAGRNINVNAMCGVQPAPDPTREDLFMFEDTISMMLVEPLIVEMTLEVGTSTGDTNIYFDNTRMKKIHYCNAIP